MSRLPVIEVELSGSHSGNLIRSHLLAPFQLLPLGSLGVAAIQLPASLTEYTRGRARQALRTNVSRAAKAGLRAELTSGDRLSSALDALTCHWKHSWDQQLRHSQELRDRFEFSTGIVVWSDADEPVAASLLLVDAQLAYMYWAGSDNRSEYRDAARYLAHLKAVEYLISKDIPYVMVEPVFRLDPGLQYFQQRLGFEPWNLRLSRNNSSSGLPPARPTISRIPTTSRPGRTDTVDPSEPPPLVSVLG